MRKIFNTQGSNYVNVFNGMKTAIVQKTGFEPEVFETKYQTISMKFDRNYDRAINRCMAP